MFESLHDKFPIGYKRLQSRVSRFEETPMSAAVEERAVAAPTAIPVKAIMPWAVLAGLFMVVAYYFVGAEQGATSVFGGMGIHEFVHDARHLLGFPCH
jgi:hypothetical protein